MTTLRYFFLFLLSFFIASCSDPAHWVARDELKPAHEPNIQKLVFMSDSELVFNNTLGWYDVEKSAIEGTDLLGSHDTVPLARIQRMELAAESNDASTIVTILFILVFGVLGGVYMFKNITPIP